MACAESNLAQSYYNFINKIPSKKWWEFVRILGLPENDIDELSYDESDFTEQRYQMLSRWKSYYGYTKANAEVIECLNLAYAEIMGNGRSENLNRLIHGSLGENRYLARTFYQVMRKTDNDRRLPFVKGKLQVPEPEVNSIIADYSKDTDEQCYQMFLSWKRRSGLTKTNQICDALEKMLSEFLILNGPSRTRTVHDLEPPSSDTGSEGRRAFGDQHHRSPTND